MDLIQYIKSTHTTQTEMARRLGVSKAAMSRYISGRRVPSREVIQKIYDATDGIVCPAVFFLTPSQRQRHSSRA